MENKKIKTSENKNTSEGMSMTMYEKSLDEVGGGMAGSHVGYYLVAMLLGSIVLSSNPREKVMKYVEGGRSLIKKIAKAVVRMRYCDEQN